MERDFGLANQTPYPGLGVTPLSVETGAPSRNISLDTQNVGFSQSDEDLLNADANAAGIGMPTTRNNPNATMQPMQEYGIGSEFNYAKAMKQAEDWRNQDRADRMKLQSDQRMTNAMVGAGNATNYASMGASLGSMAGGVGAVAGFAGGLLLDQVSAYYDGKKQKRLAEAQRQLAKKQERIENAERLRQRQLSNFELGMRASDKELADRLTNEAQALKFRQALNNIANQKMARMGINPYGQNGYQSSSFGGVRVNPNRVYGLAEQSGVELPRV